ncbi:competence type IV pilus assembly protein ComGB [Sporosarcina thermotolerans]|uniref:Competence type IV pilus assembly protein ComGB n=1 Tax=Sporosarcina thermotolerans TaxID=633404 RepID=A0AAW9ADX5_9BACL|nr:competence type IV pilus assembly protein ComGB [Sporosarcina thermotolerans]MDW0117341.1 competence type IV pilus assembly protein ComGB [Sporosarcina thermotolerans]WHT47490.1 competence type IV pilus assembly protein ComGB [Sporosarcina thermotolerans]
MAKKGFKVFVGTSQNIENRPAFLERLSILLQEGYTFHESLVLLLPHHSKSYSELLERVETDLKSGQGVTSILERLGFSQSVLLPVVVSEVDGRLAETLKGIAERLKKTDERRKKLRNLLLYPLVLFFFMTILLLAYRNYFLPNLQALSISRNEEGSGFVDMLPLIVSKIPDVVVGSVLVVIIVATAGLIFYRKLMPSSKISFLLKLPLIRWFFTKLKTRDFAGEIGSLLQSGLSMQDALEVLVVQKVDPIMSEVASTIKKHVVYGESFDQAIYLTSGLLDELGAYAKHGSDTGHLAKELIIYSEKLNEVVEEEIGKWLAMLQPILFTILAICILSAYLALLLPVYGMFDKI